MNQYEYLRSRGMQIECQEENYLLDNTSWNMLKRNKNLILSRQLTNEEKYKNMPLSDMINCGKIAFYYNEILKLSIFNFEHYLKCYMNKIYDTMDNESQKEINIKIKKKYRQILYKDAYLSKSCQRKVQYKRNNLSKTQKKEISMRLKKLL